MCRPEVIFDSPTSCEGESRHSAPESGILTAPFPALRITPGRVDVPVMDSAVGSVAVPRRACSSSTPFPKRKQSAPKLVVFTPAIPGLADRRCSARAQVVHRSYTGRAQVVRRSRRGRDLAPRPTPPRPCPLTDRLRRPLTNLDPPFWVSSTTLGRDLCSFEALADPVNPSRPSEPQPTQRTPADPENPSRPSEPQPTQ